MEHIAIDWFAPVILVTLYAEKPNNAELIAHTIADAKKNPDITSVVVQERHLPKAPKHTVYGGRCV